MARGHFVTSFTASRSWGVASKSGVSSAT